MKSIITGVAAVLLCATSALADLNGTEMTLSVTHDGTFGALSAINNVTYTYGADSTYAVANWGSMVASSPVADLPSSLENAIKLDFSDFAYGLFVSPFPAMGTVKLTDIDEPFDIASVQILVNGMNIASGVSNVGNGFQASWSAPVAFSANPDEPQVIVGWNSVPVPGPGGLALLGLAALARRRRRS